MSNNKIGSIIKELLYRNNIKPSDLAKATEIPPPTIHRIITGQTLNPYQNSLKKIADFFGITIKQLIGEENLDYNKNSEHVVNNLTNNVYINLISWKDLNKLEIKHSITKIVASNVSKKSFALLCDDYSMEPMFKKDSILIFDPEKTFVDHSYILVEIYPDLFLFRQLILDGNIKYIKALNPDLQKNNYRKLQDNDVILATLAEIRYII